MVAPRVDFACELQSDALQTLFADPTVVDDLVALKAGVVLGLLDLSLERAAVVQQLNEAGIPLTAWLLLPKDEGYWFNAANAPQAAACYRDFRVWTAEHGLQWDGVGMDIEPDFYEFQQLLSPGRWRLLPRMLRRAFNKEVVRRAQVAYSALVTQMRADGHRVETYQFPAIIDERRAGSTLLQQVFGVVDLQADREVLMLYTSFFRAVGPGVLWSYARDAQAIAVGSTGGGDEVETEIPPLDWEEFARDLRLAKRWRDEIFVFSLEGCVRQGFLGKLRDLDWDGEVTPPLKSAGQVDSFRRGLQAVLWASAHPYLVLASLVGLVWLFSRLCRSDKQPEASSTRLEQVQR
jgi:hypothetical protein